MRIFLTIIALVLMWMSGFSFAMAHHEFASAFFLYYFGIQ